MSLRIYDQLEQGSSAWLEARCGLLTASIVGQLITGKTLAVSKSDTARAVMDTLVAERLTRYVEPMFTTFDMERGITEEPFARDLYAEHTGTQVTEVGLMVREIEGYRLGYSPDGLVADDGLIEIKSRKAKRHLRTILTDAVPAENMAQLQTGLLVSGREWIDYVSFSAGMPLHVIRVGPDPRWHDAICAALVEFETYADSATRLYQDITQGMPICPRVEQDIVI